MTRKTTFESKRINEKILNNTSLLVYHGPMTRKGAKDLRESALMEAQMDESWAETMKYLPFSHLGEAEVLLLKSPIFLVSESRSFKNQLYE